MPPILLIAHDPGARAAIAPLAASPRYRAFEFAPARAEHEPYWRDALSPARAIVVGTSDSATGRAVEAAARRAAAERGVAVVAIEDYPGNYQHVARADTRLLVVESDSVRALHRVRLAAACPEITICASVRYDAERAASAQLRSATAHTWSMQSGAGAILWAGQPETGDALTTLSAVLPLLRADRARLLFKAHPRDAGYGTDVYARLFAAADVDWLDVTTLSVPQTFALAPRLIVTQFSSVAIEGGFYGIPSLHVLLPDAGGARLQPKKGYAIPPFCEAGAAMVAADARGLRDAWDAALHDARFRARVMRCFDDYFSCGAAALPRLEAALDAVLGG